MSFMPAPSKLICSHLTPRSYANIRFLATTLQYYPYRLHHLLLNGSSENLVFGELYLSYKR